MPRRFSGAFLLLLLSAAAFAQNRGPRGELVAVPAVVPIDKLPEFDVADIQATKDSGPPRVQIQPGGRFDFHALPLKFAVLAAWGYENDEGRVAGGPSWVGSEKFDIVAKAPPDSNVITLRLMLRNLLIKRFGLEVHMEDQMRPVYALEKGKAALKLVKPAKEGFAECGRSMENSVIYLTCHNMTLDELANALPGMAPAYVDKPVVNLTGLEGQFDFKFGWTPRGQLLGTGDGRRAQGAASSDGGLSTSDPTAGGLTVFESIDKQLGLKLSSTKHAIPVVVIDKVNRTPVEN